MSAALSVSPVAAAEEADHGVVAWRYESLRRAGYLADEAERLSCDRTVDLHRAVDLLERGCEPALAVRVLL